jgi:hypothetical protein
MGNMVSWRAWEQRMTELVGIFIASGLSGEAVVMAMTRTLARLKLRKLPK